MGCIWQQPISIKGGNITKSKQNLSHLICESNGLRTVIHSCLSGSLQGDSRNKRVQTKLSDFNPGSPSTQCSRGTISLDLNYTPLCLPSILLSLLSDFISGSAGSCLSERRSGLGESCLFQASVLRRVRRGI